MLRLSKMADYGTAVLTTMIREPDRSRSAAEIAAALHVPAPTVSKILKILARAGLVISLRGAKGGYLLARPAGKISLADIIQAMDGPIGMTECSITPGLCAQETGCAVRSNWQRVNHAVLGVLQGFTLDQMIEPAGPAIDAGAIRLTCRPKCHPEAAPAAIDRI
ncbi:MAG TPA: SUF system Fe-S cluster assembly regulator [Noviherbaspirillum sp.]|nr:SUF system Fe-S cluster assembly regulator [Noviherbaspirillum sp.]